MQVYAVRQITTYLRELLDSNGLLADIWISGEVSNLSRPQSGHIYFTLKDGDSSLRCVFFRNQNARSRTGHEAIEAGHQVVAHGRVSFYEVRGDLQFYVDFVQPEGVGVLQAELERLKARLDEEGLFEAGRKRPLPPFPRRIGVVTSPAGAAWHDICQVLERRWPLAQLVLAPTAVQGIDAAPAVAEALRALSAKSDIEVIIVARGGGSLEDLWAFNTEPVVRAIFGSVVPVVSGVGHETDTTLADLVADLRAPTPSAAAELVAPDRTEVAVRLSVAAGTLLSCVREQLAGSGTAVAGAADRMQRAVPDVNRERQRVDDLTRSALRAADGLAQTFQKGVHGFARALHSLDPYATLQRGYALVQRDGHVVDSVAAAGVGERLNVRVRDGDFPVRVDSGRPVADRARRRKAAVAAEQQPLFMLEA